LRRVGPRRQSPAMGLDDRSADRDAHAHAVGLGGEGGLEDAIGRGGIQPRAAIRDRHAYLARSDGLLRYRQHLRLAPDRAHRLNAVHDQVQEHLLQLYPVAEDLLAAGGQTHLKGDVALLQLAAGERQYLFDGIIDVEPGHLRSGLRGERAEASDHIASAAGVPQYPRSKPICATRPVPRARSTSHAVAAP